MAKRILTPEELEVKRLKKNAEASARYANNKEAINTRRAKKKASLPPEELEVKKAKKRECDRVSRAKKKETLTPEEI